MEKPTCKTCPFWARTERPVSLPGGMGPDEVNEWTRALGECRLSSFRHTAAPGDWCGFHPKFPAYIASLKATVPPR